MCQYTAAAATAAAANRHCTGQFVEKLLPILWPISPCVLPTIFKCTAVQCINCKDCMGNSGFVSEWIWCLGNYEPTILKCMNLYGSLPSFWSSMTKQFKTLPISKVRIRRRVAGNFFLLVIMSCTHIRVQNYLSHDLIFIIEGNLKAWQNLHFSSSRAAWLSRYQ